MNSEKIGVLLPVYAKDKPEYLSSALESILCQTYPNFTLYLGIDGPISDEVNDIIKSYQIDKRVIPVEFRENRGLAIVLNNLIDKAFNDGIQYLARMDADDISLPDRFEKQINFLLENREIDVVGGAITEIDENGMSRNKTIIYPATHQECYSFFSKRNPHAHPAVMFRKRFFDKIGHLYRPEYRQNQDTMLWLDGFSNGTKNANISDVILKFRMTDSLFKKRRNGWKFAKKQLKDRLKINRTLGYGLSADIFGILMFTLLVSPTGVRKIAYKLFR